MKNEQKKAQLEKRQKIWRAASRMVAHAKKLQAERKAKA